MPSTFLTFKERERLTSFPDEIPQWDLGALDDSYTQRKPLYNRGNDQER